MKELRKFIPEIKLIVTMADKPDVYYTIRSSKDAHEMALEVFNKGTFIFREEAFLICLNKANRAIGWYRISAGGQSGTIMDPKIIFTLCLNCPGTASFLIMHNHPSGNLQPSEADLKITRKLLDGGQLLDLVMLDHLIVSPDGYYSMADEGRM